MVLDGKSQCTFSLWLYDKFQTHQAAKVAAYFWDPGSPPK